MATLWPSEIFDAIVAAMTSIEVPADENPFRLLEGSIDDLANTPGDNHYILLGRAQPDFIPENGIGTNQCAMTWELTFVVARTHEAIRKMADNSLRINTVLHRLQHFEPRLGHTDVVPLDYDYDAIENGIVAMWNIIPQFGG